MSHSRHSKSSIFLLEIMLNICLFSLLLVICLELFIKAHNISNETTVLSHAVTSTTSIAEGFRGENGNPESLLPLFPKATYSGAQMIIYYNDQFEECSSEEAAYSATVNFTSGESITTADISFEDSGSKSVVYNITVSVHSSFNRNSDISEEQLNAEGGTVDET